MTKSTAVWLALVLLAPAAAAQSRMDERWPLESGGSVRIDWPAGTVRVTGWDAESLAVSAQLESGAGRFVAAGDAHVRKLGVAITDRAPKAGTARLEVHVPRDATVWVRTGTADIAVEGVDGTLDLSSTGGAIRVVGTPRDVTAETLGGNVEIAGGTGRTRVKTVSGDILLRGASQDLGASTLSGRITVRAAGWQRGGTGVQRGTFESVTGAVRFEGELGRGGVLELESQSGGIELRLPASAVLDFDALTIGGTITNTLGGERARPRPGGTGQELRFSTGVGGAQVTVRSFNGSISLVPKP
jgi:hypothetical protein